MKLKTLVSALLACAAAPFAHAAVTITSPADYAPAVATLPDRLKTYNADSSTYQYATYSTASTTARQELSTAYAASPTAITLAWTGSSGSCTVTVKRVCDGKTVLSTTTSGTSVEFKDPEIGRNYIWTVMNGSTTVTGHFFTERVAPRIINATSGGIRNARDLGGWSAMSNKVVKQGMIFRTREWDWVSNGILDSYPKPYWRDTIGVKLDIDLRKRATVNASYHPTNDTNWALNKSPIDYSIPRYHVENDGASPFGGYGNLNDTSDRKCIYYYFQKFINSANYPIIFHCSHGKDRTGSLALVLSGLLGVSRSDMNLDWIYSWGENAAYTLTAWDLDYAYNAINGNYTGSTFADKCVAYIKKCYTDQGKTATQAATDIATFRALMLEDPETAAVDPSGYGDEHDEVTYREYWWFRSNGGGTWPSTSGYFYTDATHKTKCLAAYGEGQHYPNDYDALAVLKPDNVAGYQYAYPACGDVKIGKLVTNGSKGLMCGIGNSPTFIMTNRTVATRTLWRHEAGVFTGGNMDFTLSGSGTGSIDIYANATIVGHDLLANTPKTIYVRFPAGKSDGATLVCDDNGTGSSNNTMKFGWFEGGQAGHTQRFVVTNSFMRFSHSSKTSKVAGALDFVFALGTNNLTTAATAPFGVTKTLVINAGSTLTVDAGGKSAGTYPLITAGTLTDNANLAASATVTGLKAGTTGSVAKSGNNINLVIANASSKTVVQVPTISASSAVYTGAVQKPTFTPTSSNYTVDWGSGDYKAVGSYTITLSLVNTTDYIWSDNTSAAKLYSYSITSGGDEPVTMTDYYWTKDTSIATYQDTGRWYKNAACSTKWNAYPNDYAAAVHFAPNAGVSQILVLDDNLNAKTGVVTFDGSASLRFGTQSFQNNSSTPLAVWTVRSGTGEALCQSLTLTGTGTGYVNVFGGATAAFMTATLSNNLSIRFEPTNCVNAAVRFYWSEASGTTTYAALTGGSASTTQSLTVSNAVAKATSTTVASGVAGKLAIDIFLGDKNTTATEAPLTFAGAFNVNAGSTLAVNANGKPVGTYPLIAAGTLTDNANLATMASVTGLASGTTASVVKSGNAINLVIASDTPQPEPPPTPSTAFDAAHTIICYGDSLTWGTSAAKVTMDSRANYFDGRLAGVTEVPQGYPYWLSSLVSNSYNVIHQSRGGAQTCNITSWSGEQQIKVKKAFTLPATGSVSVSTNFVFNNGPWGEWGGWVYLSPQDQSQPRNQDVFNRWAGFVTPVYPLYEQYDAAKTHLSVTGTLDGRRVRLSGLHPTNITVTVFGNGQVQTIAADTPFIPDSTTVGPYTNAIRIICAGANDGSANYTEKVKPLLQAFAAKGGKYLIVSPSVNTGTAKPATSPTEIEKSMATDFGDHYLNLRLKMETDAKTTAEALDVGFTGLWTATNGTGLKAINDSTHFSEKGYKVMAEFIRQKLAALGYLTDTPTPVPPPTPSTAFDSAHTIICYGDSLTEGLCASNLTYDARGNFHEGRLAGLTDTASYPYALAGLVPNTYNVLKQSRSGSPAHQMTAWSGGSTVVVDRAFTLPAVGSVTIATNLVFQNCPWGKWGRWAGTGKDEVEKEDTFNRWAGFVTPIYPLMEAYDEAKTRYSVTGTLAGRRVRVQGLHPTNVTVTVFGEGQETPVPVGSVLTLDNYELPFYSNAVRVVCGSGNDSYTNLASFVERVERYFDGFAALGGKYVIVSQECQTHDAKKGETQLQTTPTEIENYLADRYGAHHLNLRMAFVTNGMVTAKALGVVPASSTATWDQALMHTDKTHLTSAGYVVMAEMVRRKLVELGYVEGGEPPTPPPGPTPTPGPITTNAMANASWGYYITGLGAASNEVAQVFTNTTETMNWTAPDDVSSVWYLVVGGGGSGGSSYADSNSGGGGGGAGGMVEAQSVSLTSRAFTVQVGQGGAAVTGTSNNAASRPAGNSGGDSTLTVNGEAVVAHGGGGGGGCGNKNGKQGGSGGGAYANSTVGACYDGEGNVGGNGSSTTAGGGGGGGAGSAGGATTTAAGGAGGAGRTSAIGAGCIAYVKDENGNDYYCAGGGGGSGSTKNGGAGGVGGGGRGNVYSGTASTVSDSGSNYGCGGGGTQGNQWKNHTSGAGFQGVVIIRYATGATPKPEPVEPQPVYDPTGDTWTFKQDNTYGYATNAVYAASKAIFEENASLVITNGATVIVTNISLGASGNVFDVRDGGNLQLTTKTAAQAAGKTWTFNLDGGSVGLYNTFNWDATDTIYLNLTNRANFLGTAANTSGKLSDMQTAVWKVSLVDSFMKFNTYGLDAAGCSMKIDNSTITGNWGFTIGSQTASLELAGAAPLIKGSNGPLTLGANLTLTLKPETSWSATTGVIHSASTKDSATVTVASGVTYKVDVTKLAGLTATQTFCIISYPTTAGACSIALPSAVEVTGEGKDNFTAAFTCSSDNHYLYLKVAPKATPGYPRWIQGATNQVLYTSWAAKNGVTDPTQAKPKAYLLNCANTDEAVVTAEKAFKITSITILPGGTVVIGEPEGDFNGKVEMRGATEIGGEYKEAYDAAARFFKAFLIYR